MDKKNILELFEDINPSPEQKERIWMDISQSVSIANKKKGHGRIPLGLAASAAAALIFISGIGVNAATGGHLWQGILSIISPARTHDEIVSKVGAIGIEGVEVYAPNIFELTEDRMVFGTSRGLVIYDRVTDKTLTTLDLQLIDSFYFNSETRSTHIFIENNDLIIYNLNRGELEKNYYIFDISEGGEGTLTQYLSGEEEEMLSVYDAGWREEQKAYSDTFEEFYDALPEINGQMYSESAYTYSGADGRKYTGFLMVRDRVFSLYVRDDETGSIAIEDLNLDILDDNLTAEIEEGDRLPGFTYTGDNEVMAEVCRYIVYEEATMYLSGDKDVVIPAPIIVEIREVDGRTKVYGDFFLYTYTRTGNMLESVSGGAAPGCLIMERDESGVLRTTVFDRAEDGGGYEESIMRICDGDEALADKLMRIPEEDRLRAREELISMYVAESGLDIKYYKDYGWDPVEIK